MAKPEWVIPRSWVICIALAIAAYAIAGEVGHFGFLVLSKRGNVDWIGRSWEVCILWLLLSSAAGWLTVILKKPSRPNVRCWPIIAISLLVTLLTGLLWKVDGVGRTGAPLGISTYLNVLWGALFGAVMPTILMWLQAFLWKKIRTVGFCYECGYNLTGNVSGRCPECGRLIEAHLSDRFGISTRLCPELNLFETVDQRNAAWQAVRHRLVRESRIWVYFTLCLAFIVTLCLYQWEYQPHSRWPWWWLVWIFVGIVQMLGSWRQHRLMRPRLRRLLIESGIPVCLRCGRDLRDAVAEPCRACRQKQPPKEDTRTS